MMFTDTISAQLSLEVTLVPTGEVLYTSTPILVDDHYRVYYSYSPVIGLDYDLGPPEVDWAPHPPDYRFVYRLPDPTIPSPSELAFVVNDPGNVYSLSVKSETLTARLLSNYNTVGFAGSAPSGDWFAIDDTTYPPDFVSALGVGQKWYRILYTAPATIYGSGIGINFNLTLTDTSTNASFDIPVHVYSLLAS